MDYLTPILKEKSFSEIKNLLENSPYMCTVKEDSEYPTYFMINYNQIKSDFSKLSVQQCRGSILHKGTHNFVCRPFDKFFNYGEPHAASIDWNSAHAEEKIDGSLIKLHYSEEYKKWIISTNGVIDAFKAPIQNDLCPYTSYGHLAYILFNNTDIFSYADKAYTHLFELVSPWTKIVIHYPFPKLYYLTSRHTNTGIYQDMANIKKDFDIPKKYSCNSLRGIVDMANNLPYDEEGYVVVDKYFHRIKVKSPAYVAVHSMKNNGVINYANILELVLKNEQEEFLNYFPEYTQNVQEVQKKYNDFIHRLSNDIQTVIGYMIHILEKDVITREERKLFAVLAKETIYPAIMFAILDKKVDIQNWKMYIESTIPKEKLWELIK